MPDIAFVFYHSDEEQPPDTAREPWVKVGTQSTTFEDDGLDIPDSSGVEAHYYHRQLFAADRVGSRRSADIVELQAYVRGKSASPSWASGASPVGLWINDGVVDFLVSIGSTIQITDRTGVVAKVLLENAPWVFGQVYRVVKQGSAYVEVFLGQESLGRIAYGTLPRSGGGPPAAGFGQFDVAGSSRAVFEQVELSLNSRLPPQWKVLRWFNQFPDIVRTAWSARNRGALRTLIGGVQTLMAYIADIAEALTAATTEVVALTVAGDTLPGSVSDPWTELTPADLSVVRRRIRVDAAGAAVTGFEYDLSGTLGLVTTDLDHYLEATVTVRSSTPDADDRIGPYLQISDGGYLVTAELIEVKPGLWGWLLTDGALTGAIVALSPTWVVSPDRAYRVELCVFSNNTALLIVDGTPVARRSVATFPVTATREVRVASYGPSGAVAQFDVEHVRAGIEGSDMRRRPMFDQAVLERLIPIGGCERNAELEKWARRMQGLHQHRGTTSVIIAEFQRVCCTDAVRIVVDDEPASWFLERSYPEVTPIFLEVGGAAGDVFIEFEYNAPLLTLDEFVAFAVRYMVPRSVKELVYWLCLATEITGASSTPSTGITEYPVNDSDHFAVGDTVTLRDAANTYQEDVTVDSIPTATTIRVTSPLASFPSGSFIRKVLART